MSNPIGRPPLYKTAEEMQEAIDAYFADCENPDKPKHITITGLALALGFATRKSLLEYEAKDEFVNTIKRAKLRVENYIENRLFEANATGSIFNLKNNFDWKDKTEVDQNLNGKLDVKQITRTIIDPANESEHTNA